MKREIICPACDPRLIEINPPTYPLLNREFEGVRRRRGRARLPMNCDHCNAEIPLLGLCFAWSLYRGVEVNGKATPEYFAWEATRIELTPAPLAPLAGWCCELCEAEVEPEDAIQVIVKERVRGPDTPGAVGGERRVALPGTYHRWCSEAATRRFYDQQRHAHGFEGCSSCEYGRIKPCPLLAEGGGS